MARKKKENGGFWKQFFHRYDVILTQHRGRDVEHRISTSRFFVMLHLLILVILIAGFTVVLLFYSPLKSLMPGYVNPQVRQQIIESYIRIDSLSEAVMRHQLYVTNIQDILRGELKVDSVSTIDSITALRSSDLMARTERESEFIRQYEESEKYNLTSQSQPKSEIDNLHFFPPMRGLIAEGFDPNKLHFGVDIASATSHNVNVALDGTILMSGYTPDHGYVIIIQHVGNLVTVYKHLDAVFKHESTKVKAGEALGTIGSKSKSADEPFLHFELWHKGTALDPTQYISF